LEEKRAPKWKDQERLGGKKVRLRNYAKSKKRLSRWEKRGKGGGDCRGGGLY